jgi:hypothetical protein
MRYFAIGFCLTFGCAPSPKTATKSPASVRAPTMFTDSAIYRARCKEADTIPRLTMIPQECTPRDQRVQIR